MKKRELSYIVGGTATMENSMELPQKTVELPCDPAVPLLDIYLNKTIIQNDTYTPVFIAALFTIAKTWNQNQSYGHHSGNHESREELEGWE